MAAVDRQAVFRRRPEVSKTSFMPIGKMPIRGSVAAACGESLSSSRARSIAASPGGVTKAPIAPSSLAIAMFAPAATSTQLRRRSRTSQRCRRRPARRRRHGARHRSQLTRNPLPGGRRAGPGIGSARGPGAPASSRIPVRRRSAAREAPEMHVDPYIALGSAMIGLLVG